MIPEHGPDHVLQIWANPEGGTTVDVFHPTGCTESDDGRTDCDVLWWVWEWHDETVAGFGLGTHRVHFWATPPGWAGATPIDADAGLAQSGPYDF